MSNNAVARVPGSIASGDLSGSYPNPTVIKINGNSVSSQTLGSSTDGYALTWSNSDGYYKALPITLSGDVTGNKSSNSVISITGNAGVVSIAATGNILTWASGTTAPGIAQAVGASGTGAALTIQSQNITTGTGGQLKLTSGTGSVAAGSVVLQTGGTTRLTANATGVITVANLGAGIVHSDASGNLTSSAVNLTAAADVTGTLPTANQVSQSMVGDVTGTTAASTVVAITGAAGSVPIATTGNILTWASGTTAPGITQTTTASATGATLTIQAQTAATTGAALTLNAGSGGTSGGLVILKPGAGASATGFIRMYDGYTGNNAIEFNPTSAGSASVTFASTATGVTYHQNATSIASGAGLTLAAQDTSFAGGTGGALVLSAGTSTGTGSVTGGSVYINTQSGTTNGSVNFRVGSTNYFNILQPNPTGAVDFNFNNTVTAPRILQQSTSTTDGYTLTIASQATSKASGVGGQLVLQAGNANGTTATGGTVSITSGTGTSVAGPVIIKTGGTTRLTANASGVITIPNLTAGIVYSDASGNLSSAANLPAVYELRFVAGLFSATTSIFTRIGARKVDLTLFPATIGTLNRTVKFEADVDKTSGATSVEFQLYDSTHGVVVTGTNQTSTNNANTLTTSAALTVGSASGNIRSDTACQYEMQMRMNGGGAGDAVFCTNAKLIITYA